MKLSFVAVLLWAANSVLNVALVCILVVKKRWRIVPWFTAWMTYQLAYALACFVTYRLGSKENYRLVYWAGALGDFLLQVTAIVEVARSTLKRDGRWVAGSRAAVLPLVAAGLIAATLLAGFMTPAAETSLDSLSARASLFSTILVCFLFMAVVRATQGLGLDWRGFIARESLGLTVWTLVAFLTDTLHAYWKMKDAFGALDNIRIAVYQAVLFYWCVSFWLPEPSPRPMPPEILQKYLNRTGRPG